MNAPNTLNSIPYSPLLKVWSWLTKPLIPIPDQYHRRNAQLLAALILFISLVLGVSIALPFYNSVGSRPLILLNQIVIVAGCIGIALCYWMARRGNIELAAKGMALVYAVCILYFAYPDYFQAEVFYTAFLLLPIMISGMFLPPRATALLVIGIFTGLLLLILSIADGETRSLLVAPAALIFVVSLIGTVTSVHARLTEKARRDELKNALDQLRLVTENAHEMITLFSMEGKLLYISRPSPEIFGPQSDAGANIFDPQWMSFVHQEDLAIGIERFQQAMVSQLDYDFEYRFRFADESYHWLETRIRFVEDAARGQKQILSVTRNIDERKVAEAALARERNLLRTLIDNLPDFIFAKNMDGQFILSNRAHHLTRGFDHEAEVLGKRSADLFDEEYAAAYAAEDAYVLEEGNAIFNIENTTVIADGTLLNTVTTKLPLRDGSGAIVGLVGVTHDITEQKRTEEALSRERNLLRTLVDALPDLIFAKDLDGHIILSNHAHNRVLGIDDEGEVLGKLTAELYEAEYSDPYTRDDAWVLNTGEPLIDREEAIIDSSDRELTVLTTKLPLRDMDGKAIGLVGVSRDVTERKRIEAELREKDMLTVALEKERELGELKNLFMTTISHEFRTPLATILTATELLERYDEKMNLEQRRERFVSIRQQVQHLTGMLKDITMVMQMQGNHLPLEAQALNLQQFCEGLVREVRTNDAGRHQFTLRLADTLDDVTVDARLLRHILINLLSNAAKYSPPLTEIGLHLSRADDRLTFTITDQGIGIRPEDHARLFDPFFRGKNVGNISGTGLGLKIVKDCVALYRGDIRVESEEGKGTRFIITLPATLTPENDLQPV